MKQFMIFLVICFVGIHCCYSQKADTIKPNKENAVHTYFIITAGIQIKAYFNDKPISAESVSDFNEYVRVNIKSLKDSWVVITGKPKYGTFDEVIKTLNRYRFKHVSKNITTD